MPLSLLLTAQLTVLTRGVGRLGAWEGLTDTVALVARRLRSGYLARWFGTGLPVDGLDLRVRIGNLDELAARLRLTGGRAGAGGPNLTEPLLGAGGVLAGALAAPLNGMVLAAVAGSLLRTWWLRLLAVLGWLTGGGLVTAVLLLGAPLVALLLLPAASSRHGGDTHDLLGALAAMALPLQQLWRQLSGAEPVRHPLLRQLLVLGDRLAALAAQALGTVAVAVTRIAPQIRPALAAVRATITAVGSTVDAILLVGQDLLAVLDLLLRGARSLPSALRRMIRAVGDLVERLGARTVVTAMGMVGTALARLGPTTRSIARYAVAAARFVARVLLDQAFVRWLLALRGITAVYARWSRRLPPAAPTPPAPRTPSPWVTSFPLPASARRLGRLLASRPALTVPSVAAPPLVGPAAVAPTAALLRRGVLPSDADPFALDRRRVQALRRFRQPPSVLAGLAAEVQAGRRSGAAAQRALALADVLAGLQPYVTRSVEQLAAGSAADVLPRIEGLLDRLDVQLRGRVADHPTRDLPEPRDVRPVVDRLVVRGRGGAGAEARYRRFVETLRREMDARAYEVPVAAAAGRAS